MPAGSISTSTRSPGAGWSIDVTAAASSRRRRAARRGGRSARADGALDDAVVLVPLPRRTRHGLRAERPSPSATFRDRGSARRPRRPDAPRARRASRTARRALRASRRRGRRARTPPPGRASRTARSGRARSKSVPEILEQPVAEAAVERAERLVQEEDPRLGCERARERDALLLAAGERRHRAALEAGEPDELEQLARRAVDLAPERRRACGGRTRRCRRRRGGGRGRDPGRPVRSRADAEARREILAVEQHASGIRHAAARRRRAGASSCRSRSARGRRRPRPRATSSDDVVERNLRRRSAL